MENISISNTANKSQPILKDGMLIPIGGIIVLENILAIVILYRCKKLNFQVKILSMNLVLSDISTGLILCLPLSFYQYGNNCEFKKYLAFVFLNVSLLTVSMYDLDICCVFALNMKYHKYVTQRRLVILCLLFWTFGTMASYLMFYSEEQPYGIGCGFMYELKKNYVSQCTKFFLLMIIISNILMYIYVLRCIMKSLRQVGNISHHPSGITKEQVGMAKKISVITACFLGIATPFYVTLTFPILDYETDWGKAIHNISAMLLCLNSAMNPVFYIWRLKEPRYHMKLLLMFWNKSYCEELRQQFNVDSATFSMESYKN